MMYMQLRKASAGRSAFRFGYVRCTLLACASPQSHQQRLEESQRSFSISLRDPRFLLLEEKCLAPGENTWTTRTMWEGCTYCNLHRRGYYSRYILIRYEL